MSFEAENTITARSGRMRTASGPRSGLQKGGDHRTRSPVRTALAVVLVFACRPVEAQTPAFGFASARGIETVRALAISHVAAETCPSLFVEPYAERLALGAIGLTDRFQLPRDVIMSVREDFARDRLGACTDAYATYGVGMAGERMDPSRRSDFRLLWRRGTDVGYRSP